jgi:hypothetical protein
MSNPNRVAFYARRSWDVVSQQSWSGAGAWQQAEAAFDAAQAAKQPGQVVRKTCVRRFNTWTVTVYQRDNRAPDRENASE